MHNERYKDVLKALGISGAIITPSTIVKDFMARDHYNEDEFEKRLNRASLLLGVNINKYDRISSIARKINQ